MESKSEDRQKFKFIPEEEDFPYEEEVIRNPYNVKSWLRYIDFKQSWFAEQTSEYKMKNRDEVRRRYLCLDITYERALRVLPGSYKLWHAYLDARVRRVQSAKPQSAAVRAVISAFERSLMYMNKMPRIWLDYTAFLSSQGYITRTREAFDRALQSLPISQHDLVWPQYLKFARKEGVPVRTRAGIYRRYIMYDPNEVEEYVEVLVRGGVYGEAALRLAKAIEDPKFFSKRGKTKREMWSDLCKILTSHPKDIPPSLNVDAIIRAGIRAQRQRNEAENNSDKKGPVIVGGGNNNKNNNNNNGIKNNNEEMSFAPAEQRDKYLGSGSEGDLWAQLAEYYIRLNHFEKARDIFEEALESVGSTGDFSIVWDKYVAFEDQVVAQTVTLVESRTLDPDEQEEEEAALELCMARYEHLLSRHPLLLNSALLRQNPHDVHEWFKRVRIVAKTDTPAAVVGTYTEALRTIDPRRATGKPHLLWAAFAKYYDAAGYYDQAVKVFEKAVREPFRHADDVASLWCEYVEMEIRHGHYPRALELCARATAKPPGTSFSLVSNSSNNNRNNSNVAARVYKSAKLWALYADLEESFGTLQETRAVYEHMFDARIVTPQVVLNYAALLEENGYYEDSFKAYERGVTLFDFPNAMPLWVAYLTKFVGRYGGRKLERARDLFEEVLRRVPPADAKVFYVMYANLEEEYGLVRHAMAIYDRATLAVAEEDRYKMYLLYIARAEEFFGVMKTRDIYERAIQALPDKYVRPAALRFANLERKLGEVDRARAIYTHCAQYCNPARDQEFWEIWRDFEVHHGNDDTFREMLRVKRSVQASYNTQINPAALETIRQSTEMAAAMMTTTTESEGGTVEPGKRPAASSMEQLELQQKQMEEGNIVQSHNDEEIDLDDDDDDDDDDNGNVEVKKEKEDNDDDDDGEIAQVPVPDAVFGGLREKAEEEKKQNAEKEKLGALERFRRAGKI